MDCWYCAKGETEPILLESTNAVENSNVLAASLPEGVYTTMRTYNKHYLFRPESHFKRLEESAAASGQKIIIDRARLRHILRIAICENQNPLYDTKIRIQIDTTRHTGDIYLITEVLHTPSVQDYQEGVLTLTRSMHRATPLAKKTGFIQIAEEIRHTLDTSIHEVLMVGEEGGLLEGLSSNFFALYKGKIFTADQGILLGVTRGLVIEAIQHLGLTLQFSAYSFSAIHDLEEAFITSTSRGVLAIRRINDIDIPSPIPGKITMQIATVYDQLLIKELILI